MSDNAVDQIQNSLIKSEFDRNEIWWYAIVCLEMEELMFWSSLVGADRSPKEAILVARQEDLGFGVLCWERKVMRAEKIIDGRVPLPARSEYISENRGAVLEKSRRGRVYPAVFRTRQGESGRRPISCVRFTL